jgi:hypothetical protein
LDLVGLVVDSQEGLEGVLEAMLSAAAAGAVVVLAVIVLAEGRAATLMLRVLMVAAVLAGEALVAIVSPVVVVFTRGAMADQVVVSGCLGKVVAEQEEFPLVLVGKGVAAAGMVALAEALAALLEEAVAQAVLL